ncbi:MAG: hypothetical protein ABL949_16235 [Fimbriimonadaceae bacterium]
MRARKLWPWVLGLAVVGIAGAIRYNAVRNDAELAEQLRLAWAEGIPTNAEQMATFYPPIDSAKNAAPYYSALFGKGNPRGYKELSEVLAFPSPKTIAAAEAVLKANSLWLSVGDRAVTFPLCQFYCDWRQGSAMYLPEVRVIERLSDLYELRAASAAARHDPKAAIGDIRRMLIIADHASNAGFFKDCYSGRMRFAKALELLAFFAFEITPHRPYLDELRRVVKNFPAFDLKRELRDSLFYSLSALELYYSPSGREKLGLKPDDVRTEDHIFQALVSLKATKISLLKRGRAVWHATEKSRHERVTYSDTEITFGPWSYQRFVSGASSISMLRMPEGAENARLQYVALIRALEKGKPKTMSFPDLVSPIDNKPLTYENDGMSISIASMNEPDGHYKVKLTMPPYQVTSKREEAQRAGTGIPPTAPTAKK